MKQDFPVFKWKSDRPFFESWLRRSGRQLTISGRMTQVALVLALENGGTSEEWRLRLRGWLEGKEIPSLDVLTQIDVILSGTVEEKGDDSEQGQLF